MTDGTCQRLAEYTDARSNSSSSSSPYLRCSLLASNTGKFSSISRQKIAVRVAPKNL